MSDQPPKFQSLAEFYPYYLGEHRNGTCRALHLLATSAVTALGLAVLLGASPWLLLALPVAGYGPAWIGHFFFERNKPATFEFPLWSLLCDWLMARDMVLGRLPILGALPERCIERLQVSKTV